MIPRASITAWRLNAPWPSSEQVEQDLAISRALVEIFSRKPLADELLFRGGTALNKLYPGRGIRYSEDIDLVQRQASPIGAIIDLIRSSLDPWLGYPKWKQSDGRFTLYYRFETTFSPVTAMRLKVEINTREHFPVLQPVSRQFSMSNSWFSGEARITTYEIDELLGTKMRALFQRRKGRDLYDLWNALDSGLVNPERVVDCFNRYMEHDNAQVSRAEFESNLHDKLRNPVFVTDMAPLLADAHGYSPFIAAIRIHQELISKLPGEPWKGLPESLLAPK